MEPVNLLWFGLILWGVFFASLWWFLRPFLTIRRCIMTLNRVMRTRSHCIELHLITIHHLKRIQERYEASISREVLAYYFNTNGYFIMIHHDLTAVKNTLLMLDVTHLHAHHKRPLLAYLVTHCHEFLRRFNAGVLGKEFWIFIQYLEHHEQVPPLAGCEAALRDTLRTFWIRIEPHKQAIANLRNGMSSHRNTNIQVYSRAIDAADEAHILFVTQEILTLCEHFLPIHECVLTWMNSELSDSPEV